MAEDEYTVLGLARFRDMQKVQITDKDLSDALDTIRTRRSYLELSSCVTVRTTRRQRVMPASTNFVRRSIQAGPARSETPDPV